MFAVVDVETTGGYASGHRMTEIAIVVHDGLREVRRYSTLLNPNRPIPAGIQALTGITQEMVSEAPEFHEVSQEIREILAEHIFVAHNVNFDYAFVKQAFADIGITYNPRRLCSVRYARQVQKGLRSYSLKNLVAHFGLQNRAPHRAWGDAEVTAEILCKLLAVDTEGLWQRAIRKNSGQFNLPANLPLTQYQALPEAAGVYYFLGREGKPIYIGKARNLRKRVASHFISDKESRRSQAFKREIYHLSFELTGSELVAGLLEDHEIRQYWPRYNRAQKQRRRRYGVYSYENQLGQTCLAANQVTVQQGFLREFYSVHEAHNWLHQQVERFSLDPSLCGFPYQVSDSEINPQLHHNGISALLQELEAEEGMQVIKTRGRTDDEDGFVIISHGNCQGYGFVPRDYPVGHIDEVMDYMQPLKASITTRGLIENALASGHYEPVSLAGEFTLDFPLSNKATLSI